MDELKHETTGCYAQSSIDVPRASLRVDGDVAGAVLRALRDLCELRPGRADRLDESGDGCSVQDPIVLAVVMLPAGTATGMGLGQRRVLTLMFVDIVQSTQRVEAMGDRSWTRLLAAYRSSVALLVVREGGRVIDRAGDGVFATFEHPVQAVRAARSIRAAITRIGLDLRIGIHTGECEVSVDGIEGVAVHTAARISAKARAGEILVSRTVKELVCGSGLQFAPARRSVLKGLRQEFRLFALDERGQSKASDEVARVAHDSKKLLLASTADIVS